MKKLFAHPAFASLCKELKKFNDIFFLLDKHESSRNNILWGIGKSNGTGQYNVVMKCSSETWLKSAHLLKITSTISAIIHSNLLSSTQRVRPGFIIQPVIFCSSVAVWIERIHRYFQFFVLSFQHPAGNKTTCCVVAAAEGTVLQSRNNSCFHQEAGGEKIIYLKEDIFWSEFASFFIFVLWTTSFKDMLETKITFEGLISNTLIQRIIYPYFLQ